MSILKSKPVSNEEFKLDNETIYKFVHIETGEVVYSTQHELRIAYRANNIYRVVYKNRSHSKGWTVDWSYTPHLRDKSSQ